MSVSTEYWQWKQGLGDKIPNALDGFEAGFAAAIKEIERLLPTQEEIQEAASKDTIQRYVWDGFVRGATYTTNRIKAAL